MTTQGSEPSPMPQTHMSSEEMARAIISKSLVNNTDFTRSGIAQVVGYRHSEQVRKQLEALEAGEFDDEIGSTDPDLVAAMAFEVAYEKTQIMLEREQLIRDRPRERVMPDPEGQPYQFTMRLQKTDEEVGVETCPINMNVLVHYQDGSTKLAKTVFTCVDWWHWEKICQEQKSKNAC